MLPWRNSVRLLSLVVAAVLVGCAEPEPPARGPRPVVVESPQPLSGNSDGIVLPGSIHARTEADLSFRIGGKLAERRVDMGAQVQPGMVLAVLDPEDARLNFAAARAAVRAAEADLVLARAEETRYRDLRARGFVGQSQLDLRINAASLAAARLEQARAELDLASNQSSYTELRADAPGVITQVIAEPGNVLAAGAPVVRFAADGGREVHVNVPEGKLDALIGSPELSVTLLSHPERRYGARVRDIDPEADPQTRTHMARIEVTDTDKHVQLGATASVLVARATDAEVFRLPATALGTVESDRAAVWRIARSDAGEIVEPVTVDVLNYLDGAVAVKGPLAVNDRLVSAGVHRLIAGMRVKPIDRAAPAAL